MPVDPVSLALGFLGGGGSTSQEQSTTVNNSSNNNFNPVITIGGGTSFAPSTPQDNNFSAATSQTTAQTQPDAGELLGAFNPINQIPPISFPINTGVDTSFADVGLEDIDFGGASQAGFNLPLLAGIAALGGLAYFATTRGGG